MHSVFLRNVQFGCLYIIVLSCCNVLEVLFKTTVLSANGDSGFMLCLQRYQGLIIDISIVY